MKNKAIKTNYKDSWLFFLKYYTNNIKNTITIIMISILISCITISFPFLTQLITSAALNNDFNAIIYFSIFLILASIIKILLNFLSDYLTEVFSTKMEILIREEMMEKFHKLSMQTFDNTPIGIFFSRILHDLKEVKLYVYTIVNNIVTIICLIIGGFSYIFFINWIAGIIIMTIYLITLIIYIIAKNNVAYHQQVNKFLNTFIDVGVGEHVQMISEIKSYNSSTASINKIKLLQNTYFKSIKKYSFKNALLKLAGSATSILISTLTLIISAILFSYDAITLPKMMGLVIVSNILTIPIQLSSFAIVDIIKLNATIVRINEFHNWNIEENKGIIKNSFEGDIEFRNVSFSYKTARENINVLKNVSFKINKNKKTLLYGDCKKGKTTIFKLLMRYYNVDSGEILIDGININNYDIDYLRNNISYLAFSPKLFSSSLQLNSIFKNKDKYNKIIKTLEIEELASRRKKIDKIINSQGLQISDSEQQMLSIARALYFDTFIVLFDFPEYSLNENQLRCVNNALNIFAKSKTIVFTAPKKYNLFKIDNFLEL